MADNVPFQSSTLATPAAATSVATDDVGGQHFQKMKIADGTADSSAMIPGDATNGLDVDVTRVQGTVAVSGPLTDTQLRASAVPVSGTVTVDSEMPAAAALADATANPTTPLVGAAVELFNGTTWDRVRGDTTNGLDVDVTRVSGTVTVDSELTTADLDTGAGTDTRAVVGLALAASGGAVLAGSANPVPVSGPLTDTQLRASAVPVSGTVTVDSELTTADLDTGAGTDTRAVVGLALAASGGAVLAGAANPVPVSGTVTSNAGTGTRDVQGNVAHNSADSGNPVKVGAKAVAHGSNPTAVAAASRTDMYANRHGVQFVIGGHPNSKSATYITTAAGTDDNVMAAIASGTKYAITRITITLSEATTVGVAVRLGFGTASVPALGASQADAVDDILVYHPGLVPGGGITIGDGSGILGVGGDGAELRITNGVPTSGTLAVTVTYFTIES